MAAQIVVSKPGNFPASLDTLLYTYGVFLMLESLLPLCDEVVAAEISGFSSRKK
jgi:hypothetical protein